MTTTLTDDREAALRVGYDAIVWPAEPASFERYQDTFSQWCVRAIERDGKCIGATYSKDGELHVAIDKEWHGRWVTRGLLKQMFDMPRVIARPICKSDQMHRYLVCLGFRDIGNNTLVLER